MVTKHKDIRIVVESITVVLFLILCNAISTHNLIDICYLIFIGICLIKLIYIKIKS